MLLRCVLLSCSNSNTGILTFVIKQRLICRQLVVKLSGKAALFVLYKAAMFVLYKAAIPVLHKAAICVLCKATVYVVLYKGAVFVLFKANYSICLGLCETAPARQAKALLHVLHCTHWAGEIIS